MPIMIPPAIPAGTPASKKFIFESLKSSHEREWVILHEIDIPLYRAPMPDFVILIPKLAFVFCLKVVESSDVPSSLKQASDAKNNLKDNMERSFRDPNFFDRSPYLEYAAVRVDGKKVKVALSGVSPEWISGDLDTVLYNHAFKVTEPLWEHWEIMPHHEEWDDRYFPWDEAQEKLNRIRTELAAIGEIIATISIMFHDNLSSGRPHLLRLTKDQSNILELVGCKLSFTGSASRSGNQTQSSNSVAAEPRCVVDGAAGTGKTVLAIEIARQRYEAGETVGLLCSNPYLSRRFEHWAGTLDPNNGGKVLVGTPATLPSLIFSGNSHLAAKHQQRLDASSDIEGSLKLGYLDKGWQPFIEETIEDLGLLGGEPVFDYLIVDEAQNLCDKIFLNLQNVLLKNGLENGRWIMFGDFENQNIVAPEIGQNGKDALRAFNSLNWEDAELRINCRNTEEIAEEIYKLVDIQSPPMSGVYGPHVQIEYFASEADLESILNNLIRDWQSRRFQSGQIILLSSGTGSEFNTARAYSGWQLLNISDAPSPQSNTLRYSNVSDFQGLESDLAILVLPMTDDQVPLAGGLILPRERHLNRVLYTGMSRARAMLVIVADQKWEETLVRREFLAN